MLGGKLGFHVAERIDLLWPPVRVLWAEKVASEKMVTDLLWAVARRGRVGCGMEYQPRW